MLASRISDRGIAVEPPPPSVDREPDAHWQFGFVARPPSIFCVTNNDGLFNTSFAVTQKPERRHLVGRPAAR
jgi:hypothetical protein